MVSSTMVFRFRYLAQSLVLFVLLALKNAFFCFLITRLTLLLIHWFAYILLLSFDRTFSLMILHMDPLKSSHRVSTEMYVVLEIRSVMLLMRSMTMVLSALSHSRILRELL